MTGEDVKQQAADWNDITVGEIRYTDFIEGDDGKVLIDLHQSDEPAIDAYIEQNSLEETGPHMYDEGKTTRQFACESLIGNGVKYLREQNGAGDEPMWVEKETDDEPNPKVFNDDYDLRDPLFEWVEADDADSER